MANSALSNCLRRNSGLALDFCVSASFVFALCFFFEPRWETNDDVGMSMVAHGYGIAAVGFPNLVFSNVIWGYLVRVIPQIHGVWGYSIATIGVLVIVGTVVLHALRQLSFGWLVSLSALILLLARPVLFPQFTINAGLLTLGAVICWHLYGHQKSRQALFIGCLLAFFGYLVRSHEFLLVLLIASPLLPWNKLAKDRTGQVSVVVLLLAIGVVSFIDYKAYQGDVWRSFNALNPARAPITDFGADAQLKKHPEILTRHGYTANDINLIRSWFFVDENIANPHRLNAMLMDLGPLPAQSNAINNGWIGVKTFVHPVLVPSILASLFLLLLMPNRKLFVTWVICIAAFFLLGVLGRPGILRVYIPVISLLLIAPLLVTGTGYGVRGTGILRWRLVQGAIVVAALFNASAVFPESRTAQLASERIREELRDFPDEPVVVWGGTFPFEALYPVLRQSDSTLAYRLYPLGVFTNAPFSVAYAEQAVGRGMVDRLTSQSGIPIVANEQQFDLLTIYCKERLGGVLQELAVQKYGQVDVRWRRCETKVTQ